jgi:UPF0755 protein
MLKKILIVLLVLLGMAGAGAALIFFIVFAPNTNIYEGERRVKIPPGSRFEQAVDSLESSGVLLSRKTLELVARTTGWGGQIKAGHYTFKSGASNYNLLDVLRKGLQSPIRVTIPPGSRPEVVAAVVARDMAFEADDLLGAIRSTDLAMELDTDTTRLFGYMLPETYHFYWLTPAATVVRRVKQSFDQFYDREIRAPADSLNLTPDDVIALAGIVEWEAHILEERPRVAGVYLNRLRIGMKLDADPTVQFVVMRREGSKRRLLYEDLRIQDPYNTYLRAGLPPGPITNPSPSSIRAVVNAERHDYLYFVARGDGGHTFSRTLGEHNRAARAFHDLMRQRRAEQARRDTTP